ncbi:hypothetical protein BX659_1481 [Orenia metallireducens]|jgi:hypothetical protein|uniref:Uncharacterized protein n=1 Tax=Orenia metallireducens TaxID=1413210 RepID=A0A285H5K4_9FIRM|nr:hypothetical protein [Orenia metallireducens]PRX17798.1 hypothetical protein BX659_1481 [Orenia metallireducens]SNY31120.1 hypothetical protein SAMN06265827_11487 [Orenia metallireducens]
MEIDIVLLLQLGCGLFWSLTYILIIVKGFQDRTYGMPMLAICANISWEFIFSFIMPHPSPQIYINIIWFLLDLIILFQFLYFGRETFKEIFYQSFFYYIFLITLIISFLTILLISYEFNDNLGKYAAFGQNLIMSILFITMLVRRGNIAGQSIFIALFKLFGTLFVSIAAYIIEYSPLITFFSIVTFFFDFIYTLLLYNYHPKSKNQTS